MAAIPPSKPTTKIIEEFIRYAQRHLSSVSGVINTTSIFPSVPSPITLPSVVNWNGYFVPPPAPTFGLSQIRQGELTDAEEEQLKQQIRAENQALANNIAGVRETIALRAVSSDFEDELTQNLIPNLEEQIENPEIVSESLRELAIQKKQIALDAGGLYDDLVAVDTSNITAVIQSGRSVFNGDSGNGGSGSTKTKATKVAVKESQKANLESIKKSLIRVGITNPTIIKAVQANSLKESGAQPVIEEIYYGGTTNKRIREIFGSRVASKTDAELNELKKTAQSWGEAMYGPPSGKVGKRLGNTQTGDGYRFRGRGFIQLTGRANYTLASMFLYKDDRLVKNPDSVATGPVAADTLAYYITNGLKTYPKLTGIPANTTSQADANVLITSMIAGDVISRSGTGFLTTESLAKVDSYSQQLA